MSEYIITCDEETASWVGNDVDSIQPLVRCEDCRFSLAHGNGCGRNQDIYDVEPDGFCAWGKRKESGE